MFQYALKLDLRQVVKTSLNHGSYSVASALKTVMLLALSHAYIPKNVVPIT